MRFLVGDTGDSSPGGVVCGALAALHDACKNQERNGDAFIYSNMAEVRTVRRKVCCAARFLLTRFLALLGAALVEVTTVARKSTTVSRERCVV